MVETEERLSYQPKVEIYGWTHDSYNVQGALRAGRAFRDFASPFPSGSSVVFFEEATDVTTSAEDRTGVITLVNNYGLASFEIALAFARRHGEPLTYTQLERYSDELGRLDVAELTQLQESGVFPLDLRLSTYVLYRYLDRIDPAGRKFFFEIEKHRRSVSRQFSRKDEDGLRRAEEVDRYMDEGDGTNASLSLRKSVYGLNRIQIRYREPRVVRQLAAVARRYDVDGIFMVYGAAHLGMDERIRRKLPRAEVRTNGNYSQPSHSRQVALLRHPEGRPDFDFKCELLVNELMTRIRMQCREEGLISGFALRYEDIQSNLWSFLYSLQEQALDSILSGGIHGIFQEVFNDVRAQIYEEGLWH